MSTNMKRLSVSVTPDLEKRLDKMKREQYYKESQATMIRELIKRGLDSLEKDIKLT